MDYLELEMIMAKVEKELENRKTEKEKEKERKNLENTSYVIREKESGRYIDTIVAKKLKDFIVNNIDKNYTSEKIKDQILFIQKNNYIISLYD